VRADAIVLNSFRILLYVPPMFWLSTLDLHGGFG